MKKFFLTILLVLCMTQFASATTIYFDNKAIKLSPTKTGILVLVNGNSEWTHFSFNFMSPNSIEEKSVGIPKCIRFFDVHDRLWIHCGAWSIAID